VIAAGAFDGDEAVVELVGGKRLPDLGDGGVEVGTLVSDGGRGEEHPAIEVGEEELGAGLGAVEADDAEVLGTDLLDARVEDAAGLAEGASRGPATRATSGTGTDHEKSLPKEKGSSHVGS
jgi:hypothetical protein